MHNHYNLFEGNWCPDYCHDGNCLGGGNCNLDNPTDSRNNVWFRERMLGWDAANGGGKVNQVNCWMTKWHTNQNVVIAGCVLGKTDKHNGYTGTTMPIFDPDANVGGSVSSRATWKQMYRKGNWTVIAGYQPDVPLSTNEVLATSYLHSSKPAWFGDRPWPPFDAAASPSVSTNMLNLPAGWRYLNGVDP
jgi:hypothetical protein